MVSEEIVSPIVSQISPDGVGVVCVVLGVVVLHQEARSVQSIIVRLSPFRCTGPGKMNVFFPFFLNPVHLNVGEILRHPVDKDEEEFSQDLLLGTRHSRREDPPGRLP